MDDEQFDQAIDAAHARAGRLESMFSLARDHLDGYPGRSHGNVKRRADMLAKAVLELLEDVQRLEASLDRKSFARKKV